jgi:hypothetical protein
VVAAVGRQLQILGGTGSDEKRLLALKYLVHLMGDVHQPLHAGYRDDKGGNKYQLQAFMKGSNLHAVWDSGLIQHLNADASAMVKKLQNLALPASTNNLSAAHAAQESCQVVAMPGFYPDQQVGPGYVQQFTGVMQTRLAMAGFRLAAALNQTLTERLGLH